MGKLLVKEKEVVVPGEELADGMDYLPGIGTYREGDKIYASKVGLTYLDGRAIKLVPLAGKYNPKKGDTIIVKVKDIAFSGWNTDTNSAYTAMLNVKDATSDFIQRGADLSQIYKIGDYLVAKIVTVTSQKLIDLSMKGPGLKKLSGGRIIKITPSKVPRLIGKKGSMVGMIKQATGCRLTVGQNGLVWLQGEDPSKELIAVNTIGLIEQKAHISGLTDLVKKHLEEATGQKLSVEGDQA
tara:strand:- start:494 stop:1213 length:720 start_codon:yes stop_codon:yes gene_type:complete